MMTMVFAAIAAVSAPQTLWVNAYEAAQGVEVPAEGTYTVWAWVKADAPRTVQVGKQEFVMDGQADAKSTRLWRKLGEANLKPGITPLNAPAEVAALVLTTSPTLDPAAFAADARVLTTPDRIVDARAQTVRETRTVFSMPEFNSLDEWESYAAKLRRRILIACGLYPLPERTPLNPIVSEAARHEDYLVERVAIEAYPGYYVTGNLYRPVGEGPFPALACPHGHWEKGRLEESERCSVPARCITFARMGIVAFSYDMVGYVDSQQFTHDAGRPGRGISPFEKQRRKLWGIHPFALQTWASMRALDYLESLPYVDRERLGCTGASGGGTQTFILTAIDPRVKVAAPVNMISCNMQGGCECENAPIIRLDASNMEIGALAAPRALMMVSATGDWTRETPRVEYPSIQSIYELYGAAERVETVLIDAPHNYNQVSREAVYRFMGKWLLGQGEKFASFTEPPYQKEADEVLRVFPSGPPENAPNATDIIDNIIAGVAAKWDSALGGIQSNRQSFLEEHGQIFADVLGTHVPAAEELAPERAGYEGREGYILEKWILRRPADGSAVPALLYRANDGVTRGAVLIVHGEGKAALVDPEQGGPGPLVRALLEQGKAVMTIDAFLTGEHHSPMARTERRYGAFPDTFMPTDTGCRVQDILTAAAYLRFRRDLTGEVDLVGLGQAGVWSLLAAAQDNSIRRVAADVNRFCASNDASWVDEYYIPCIRGVGDLNTAAAFIAPRPMALFNAAAPFDAAPIERSYAMAQGTALTLSAAEPSAGAIVEALR